MAKQVKSEKSGAAKGGETPPAAPAPTPLSPSAGASTRGRDGAARSAQHASKPDDGERAKKDDLTAITGIGPATARKLAGAGISSFAALATLDSAKQAELDGVLDMPGGSDWPVWTREASALAAGSSEDKNSDAAADGKAAGGEKDAGGKPVSGAPLSPPEPPGAGPDGFASPAEGEKEQCGPEGYTVVVTSKTKRRRRAGREFGKHATRIPAPALSVSEVAAIRADPVLDLRVEEATGEDADAVRAVEESESQ